MLQMDAKWLFSVSWNTDQKLWCWRKNLKNNVTDKAETELLFKNDIMRLQKLLWVSLFLYFYYKWNFFIPSAHTIILLLLTMIRWLVCDS